MRNTSQAKIARWRRGIERRTQTRSMNGEFRRGVETIVLSYERLIALVQRAVEAAPFRRILDSRKKTIAGRGQPPKL
jgi:hypothetical protein